MPLVLVECTVGHGRGRFTTSCLRRLAATGYSVTTIAPGNNKSEILRVLPELAPHFDQVVLLGYPPFLKHVIDTGLRWQRFRVKLVFAGEVLRLNSEYAHYVPAAQQVPHIQLRPSGDPDYFPVGVKHRYTRT